MYKMTLNSLKYEIFTIHSIFPNKKKLYKLVYKWYINTGYMTLVTALSITIRVK